MYINLIQNGKGERNLLAEGYVYEIFRAKKHSSSSITTTMMRVKLARIHTLMTHGFAPPSGIITPPSASSKSDKSILVDEEWSSSLLRSCRNDDDDDDDEGGGERTNVVDAERAMTPSQHLVAAAVIIDSATAAAAVIIVCPACFSSFSQEVCVGICPLYGSLTTKPKYNANSLHLCSPHTNLEV